MEKMFLFERPPVTQSLSIKRRFSFLDRGMSCCSGFFCIPYFAIKSCLVVSAQLEIKLSSVETIESLWSSHEPMIILENEKKKEANRLW